jgi:hypothetical protein
MWKKKEERERGGREERKTKEEKAIPGRKAIFILMNASLQSARRYLAFL